MWHIFESKALFNKIQIFIVNGEAKGALSSELRDEWRTAPQTLNSEPWIANIGKKIIENDVVNGAANIV